MFENFLYFGDENFDVIVIKNFVKEIYNEIKKEEYVENSNEFIECLINKDEFVLVEIFEKYKFLKEFF